MNMHHTVTSRGGNQYQVNIDGKVKIVDLDGFIVMSDDEYNKILEAEKATGKSYLQDEMECPRSARETGLWDTHELAALEHAARYSGFMADAYLTALGE